MVKLEHESSVWAHKITQVYTTSNINATFLLIYRVFYLLYLIFFLHILPLSCHSFPVHAKRIIFFCLVHLKPANIKNLHDRNFALNAQTCTITQEVRYVRCTVHHVSSKISAYIGWWLLLLLYSCSQSNAKYWKKKLLANTDT